MKKNKGFTLAEMLIVVAIIGVLIAVAMPIINTALEKSREATDMANIATACERIVTAYLDQDAPKTMYANTNSYEMMTEKPYYITSAKCYAMTVKAKQKISMWQSNNDSREVMIGNVSVTCVTPQKYFLIRFYPDSDTWDGSPKGGN